jgi:hypothetical protein
MSKKRIKKNNHSPLRILYDKDTLRMPQVPKEPKTSFLTKTKDIAQTVGTKIKNATCIAGNSIKLGVYATGRFFKGRVDAIQETVSTLYELVRNFRKIEDECLALARLMGAEADKLDAIERLETLRDKMTHQVELIDRAITTLKEHPQEASDALTQPV